MPSNTALSTDLSKATISVAVSSAVQEWSIDASVAAHRITFLGCCLHPNEFKDLLVEIHVRVGDPQNGKIGLVNLYEPMHYGSVGYKMSLESVLCVELSVSANYLQSMSSTIGIAGRKHSLELHCVGMAVDEEQEARLLKENHTAYVVAAHLYGDDTHIQTRASVETK